MQGVVPIEGLAGVMLSFLPMTLRRNILLDCECVQHIVDCATDLQDDDTVHDLALNERAEKMTGWPQRAHAWFFDRDFFASVASDDALMRIHGTAEEFEPAAEECFIPFQAGHKCCCLLLTFPFALNLGTFRV